MTVLTFSKDFKPAEQISIEIRLPFYLYNHIYNVNDYKYYVKGYIYSESRNVTVSIKGLDRVLGFGGGQEYETHSYALDYNEFTFSIDAYSEFVLDEVVRIIFATIMVFLFYVVPMLVMLILFIRRKNKSNLRVLYLQKFLFYTFSFFSLFFLLAFPKDLTPAIVLLCGFGVLTLITLLQNILRNCKNFNSLIAETMCWAMNIYYLVKDLETVYINIWIFGFIDFIFILFKIRKTVKMDPALQNHLPVGILYSLENWIIYLYFNITSCTTFITSEALGDRFEIFFVPLPFIFIFYFVGMILRYRFLFLKLFREFYKDLDLEALEKKIQKRQELPNLHPETINFYNILLAQHCLAHNMEKTRLYVKKTYLPKTKGYVLSYRGMNMRYGQTKEELEYGYEVLKREYYNNKLALKSFDKFYKFWLPYYGTNPSQDIKKVYNYHRKNNEFSNAISLFVLIYYYKNENDVSKVEELKKEFISKYGNLTEFVNGLNAL